MENAAEALKMAGFTLLFVSALAIAMATIMQAKNTSEDIISYSDKTKYYSEFEVQQDNEGKSISTDGNGNRIVSVYDIIPTLYRYDKEGYIILFNQNNGERLNVFSGQIIDNYNSENRKYLDNKNILKPGRTDGNLSFLNYNLEDKIEAVWRHDTNAHIKNIVGNLLKNNVAPNGFIETTGTTDNKYLNNAGIVIEDNDNSTDSEENVKEEIKVITYTAR